MALARIEATFDVEHWGVIAIDLALANMSTPQGRKFLRQLIGRIRHARDQDCDEVAGLRDRARGYYRKVVDAGMLLIDGVAPVYADGQGGNWVQGWVKVPGAPAAKT